MTTSSASESVFWGEDKGTERIDVDVVDGEERGLYTLPVVDVDVDVDELEGAGDICTCICIVVVG